MLARKELPEIGEYVIATVREIYDYGAYVTLDEYGDLKAFLPWSEVATKWVKNIRDVIREGEKIVAKVIRIDRARKEVDVSLKKVSDIDKRKKMMWWKRYVKAAKIAELVAESLGKTKEAAYKEVVWKLEDSYGDPLYALEEAVLSGRDILEKAGIPSEWIEPLLNEAKRHIKVKEVSIRVRLLLQSRHPDGVERVRKVLDVIAESLNSENAKFKLYSAGAPRYILEVYSHDYKTAESIVEKILKKAEEASSEYGVIFKGEREKA